MIEALAAARDTSAAECPDGQLLVAFAIGDGLPAPFERTLQAHLSRCLACAVEVERLTAEGPILKGLPTLSAPRPGGVRSIARRLSALVAFEMPPALTLVTRGSATAHEGPAYRKAMKAYERGRYAEAAAALLHARSEGEGSPELPLYLGACLLREGRAEEARTELARAVRARPWFADARWYLAQALLAAGKGAEALRQLERAAREPGVHRQLAAELAPRVRSLLG